MQHTLKDLQLWMNLRMIDADLARGYALSGEIPLQCALCGNLTNGIGNKRAGDFVALFAVCIDCEEKYGGEGAVIDKVVASLDLASFTKEAIWQEAYSVVNQHPLTLEEMNAAQILGIKAEQVSDEKLARMKATRRMIPQDGFFSMLHKGTCYVSEKAVYGASSYFADPNKFLSCFCRTSAIYHLLDQEGGDRYLETVETQSNGKQVTVPNRLIEAAGKLALNAEGHLDTAQLEHAMAIALEGSCRMLRWVN